MGILLCIAAMILILIVGIPCFIIGLWINRRDLDTYMGHLAYALDEGGNVIIAPLANLILIKKGGYKFGNWRESISSVLGKNKENITHVPGVDPASGTLTRLGYKIYFVLDKIRKNHCENSIESA